MTPAIPLLLLGLADAAFSGFRAYAGRDARIRKHRHVVRSALRGRPSGLSRWSPRRWPEPSCS